MFNCFRIPYQTIVYAAGHFKQTRNGSIVEVILNLSISIILVIKIGLIGVAIGTLVGSIFRTLQYGIYLSRNIIVRSNWLFYTKIVISLLETMIIYIISSIFINISNVSYFGWISYAINIFMLSIAIVCMGSFLFYRKDTISIIKRLIFALKR